MDYRNIDPKRWLFAVFKVFLAGFAVFGASIAVVGVFCHYVLDFEPMKAAVYGSAVAASPLALFIRRVYHQQYPGLDYAESPPSNATPPE